MYMKVAVDRVRRADGWWVAVMIGSEREEHGPYDEERAAAEEQLELVEEFQLRTGDGREVTLLPVGISVSPRPLSVEGLLDALSDNGLDVAVARLPGSGRRRRVPCPRRARRGRGPAYLGGARAPIDRGCRAPG